jgi:hypothetical protein
MQTPRREADAFAARQPSGGSSFLFPGSVPRSSPAVFSGVQSRSSALPSALHFSASKGIARHGQEPLAKPAGGPSDERPPLESILDGGVAQGAAAQGTTPAAAAPELPPSARPPVENTEDGFWVTVFGYHTPSMIPQVLQEMRPSSGVLHHTRGVGAWLHVRYSEWHQQQEALAKNGRVRAPAPRHGNSLSFA